MIKYKKSSFFAYGLLLTLAFSCFTPDAYCQNDQIAMMLQTMPPKGGTITPGAGVHSFSVNSEVVLTAVPKPGYQFIYWMGDVSDPTSPNTTAYLDSPKIIIAVFERSEFEFEFHVVERAGSTPTGGMRASAPDYSRQGYTGGGAKRPHKWRWPSFEPPPKSEPDEPDEPQQDDFFPVPDESDNQAFPVPQPNPEPATGLLLITGAFLAVRFRSRKAVKSTTIKLITIFAIFLCLFTTASLRAEAPGVILETNHGNIIIELFDDEAPVTVNNFLTYVRDGFYDGLIFHRVIPDFMIQAGLTPELTDPNGIRDPIPNEFSLSNLRGTVAMAKLGGDPDSATSEFFINLGDNTFLDAQNGGFTVFGQVSPEDMNEVVDVIAQVETGVEVSPQYGEMNDVPVNDVIIYSASIFSDFDGDSFVNFTDYSILANQWLEDCDFTKIADPEPAAGNEFGYSVSFGGQYGLAGSPGDVPNGNNAGHATLIKPDGSKFSFTADDTGSGDWFGFAVSMSDDLAFVSAPGHNSERGAAYVFQCTDTNCTELVRFTDPNGQPGDWFGYSVSIDAIYNAAIIGAVGDDELGSNAGAAYIAVEEPVKITASDGAAGDKFGYSVGIDDNGFAIVGATRDDDNGTDSGSAYIFEDSGGVWTQKVKLTASDGAAGDWFGYSVCIEGIYAAVGAIYDDDRGSKSGSVYIFENDGENWVQQTKIVAFDGEAFDRFGYSVSLYHDQYGDYCVISAVRDDDGAADGGAVYLYKYNGTTWAFKNKYTAPDANDADYFGHSVSMDGKIIAGAIGDDDNGSKSGSVYLFGSCPITDLDGDCVVDYHDLRILADNWLAE